MVSSATVWIFLFAAACCNEVVAFWAHGVQPHKRQLQNVKQSIRQAASIPNDSYDFESLVEAPTSGSTGTYGGDFAGLTATYDPIDGSFVPIPEYLIPDELTEWGQEPNCLEILVSEDITLGENNQEHTMTRATTTILPCTGCSVDNLETTLAKDEIDFESLIRSIENDGQGVGEMVGLQYPLVNDNLRVETIFGLEEEEGTDRIRVVIDLIPSHEGFAIKNPMMLTLERQTSSISSGGTISKGGGLDGQSIYRLLGERLRRVTTFQEEPLSCENPYCDNDDHNNDIHFVNIALNISIAYGWLRDRNSWMLQVCNVKPNGFRRVISRQFTIANNGEFDFEIKSWVENPK